MNKRPSIFGYIKFCLQHGLSDWGSYCLMSQIDTSGWAKVGGEIPWKPGYYLWPDGTERQEKPSRKELRNPPPCRPAP
jgi:hypothetical protein